MKASLEPEAALVASNLHVPRMVMPQDTQPINPAINMDSMRKLLTTHVENAMAARDMDNLLKAYMALDALCQQYLRDAVHRLGGQESVPVWHHKTLYLWCAQLDPHRTGR